MHWVAVNPHMYSLSLFQPRAGRNAPSEAHGLSMPQYTHHDKYNLGTVALGDNALTCATRSYLDWPEPPSLILALPHYQTCRHCHQTSSP